MPDACIEQDHKLLTCINIKIMQSCLKCQIENGNGNGWLDRVDGRMCTEEIDEIMWVVNYMAVPNFTKSTILTLLAAGFPSRQPRYKCHNLHLHLHVITAFPMNYANLTIVNKMNHFICHFSRDIIPRRLSSVSNPSISAASHLRQIIRLCAILVPQAAIPQLACSLYHVDLERYSNICNDNI